MRVKTIQEGALSRTCSILIVGCLVGFISHAANYQLTSRKELKFTDTEQSYKTYVIAAVLLLIRLLDYNNDDLIATILNAK